MKLTPFLVYAILAIVDNFLHLPLPICKKIMGYSNQGALGNVLSLCMIILFVIGIPLEQWLIRRHSYKHVCIAEIIMLLLLTCYTCFIGLIPFPTLRTLLYDYWGWIC